MKLFLIKFGKAFQAIKRDGLIRGGKRVLQASGAMFHRVPPADVLFVAGGVGDSTRYNCHHQAEELGNQGINCSVTVQDNPLLGSYADKFKIFIFHRTLNTRSLEKFVAKIKQQKKEIIFSSDDLVFDPKYFKYMNYLENANQFERMLYEKGVGAELLADPYVTTAVTTTSFLQEKLISYGKQVFVSRNKLSEEDVNNCRALLDERKRVKNNRVRVGYFSGTISHNRDFATISSALMDLMVKYPQMQLVIVGHLDIDHALSRYSDRIEQLPFVPRKQHFANIASVDINISPLEIENPFCQAKSELKFFEAGILQVPTVATATETFREAIADGVDGFIASSSDEWRKKLSLLITNSDLRQRMGQKAREKTLQFYTTEGIGNEAYYDYLRSKL